MFELYIFKNLNLLQSFKTHVLAIVLPFRFFTLPRPRCCPCRGLVKVLSGLVTGPKRNETIKKLKYSVIYPRKLTVND